MHWIPFLLHNSSFFLRRIHRLERQLHRQKSPPKTFSVSSHLKYVAATNSQLRKGAWLQRSFTLSTLTCSPRDEPAVVGRAVALCKGGFRKSLAEHDKIDSKRFGSGFVA